MSRIIITQDTLMVSLEAIIEANRAILCCTSLLAQFVEDDDSEPEIPDSIKNNYIRRGLLDAMHCAGQRISSEYDILLQFIRNAQGGAV
jgi:hypothetical protein